MTSTANDDSTFMAVVRHSYDSLFRWEGTLEFALESERRLGPGFVYSSDLGAGGGMQYDDTGLIGCLAQGKIADFADLLPSSPGRLLSRDRYATVRPEEGDAFVAHGATIVRRSGDIFRPDVEFKIYHGLTVRGPSMSDDGAYFRHVFRGGRLSCASTYTVVDDFGSTQLDRIDGQFRGRRVTLRAPHELRDTGTLFATLGPPELSETEDLALWLLLCFLSGNRVSPTATETFDADGALISRTYRTGTPTSRNTTPPFDFRFPALGVNLFATSFVAMLDAGYPINNILHHLHDADGSSVDTDLQHLLLAVHASFEAWNRICGRRRWLLAEDWEGLRRAILSVLEPIIAPLELGQRQAVEGSISRWNETSMGYRERDFFRALAIDLTRADRIALQDRNELLHNGYFLRRFEQLNSDERQERYDKMGHLRNLLYLTILRIAGYSGPIHEYTRLGIRNIESPAGPITFPVALE